MLIYYSTLPNRFGECKGGSHAFSKKSTKKVIQNATILYVNKVKMNDFYKIETMGTECISKYCSYDYSKCPVKSTH